MADLVVRGLDINMVEIYDTGSWQWREIEFHGKAIYWNTNYVTFIAFVSFISL